MKKFFLSGAIVVGLLMFGLNLEAGKPVDENGVPFGNGYPSGEHYNLNIHGKIADFHCPAPQFDPETGQQIYGNVINIPREQGNDAISILMESGKKGPKGAQDITELQVTDWCTESFPDNGDGGNGDPAVLRLPANDKGYAVYAQITGKPSKEPGEPSISITPNLFYVEDEAGNDLILLGLVDRQGVASFSSTGEVIRRTSTEPSKKGKGVQNAKDITALFEWTGEVCYLQDSDLYCIDDENNYVCTDLAICCVDNVTIDPVTGEELPGPDGIYEACDLLADVGVLSDDGITLMCPDADGDGALDDPIIAQCRSYENEWVFNIADFVGYLWNIDSTGAYNIKVRFYPIK